MIKTSTHTTLHCDKDKDFRLMVTPQKDGTLTIHGCNLDVSLHITREQAVDLRFHLNEKLKE